MDHLPRETSLAIFRHHQISPLRSFSGCLARGSIEVWCKANSIFSQAATGNPHRSTLDQNRLHRPGVQLKARRLGTTAAPSSDRFMLTARHSATCRDDRPGIPSTIVGLLEGPFALEA